MFLCVSKEKSIGRSSFDLVLNNICNQPTWVNQKINSVKIWENRRHDKLKVENMGQLDNALLVYRLSNNTFRNKEFAFCNWLLHLSYEYFTFKYFVATQHCFFYIKWYKKNYYTGRLWSKHFNQLCCKNSFCPIL